MEGKLLKILEDFVYEQNGKSVSLEPIDFVIHVNSFWFTKINKELREYIGNVAGFSPMLIEDINNTTFRFMGSKVEFRMNRGEIRSAATDDFFEFVYNKLP